MFGPRLEYWKIKSSFFLKKNPLVVCCMVCAVLVLAGGAFFFRRAILLELKSVQGSSSIIWLKVIAFGFIPMLLAIFGAHYAAEAIRGKGRKLTIRLIFWASGMLAVVITLHIEAKSEVEHKAEVVALNAKLGFVQQQNTEILGHFVNQPVDSKTAEALRHEAILTLLRHEWILSHKDVSSSLLAGTEQPPAQWVNQRLKQLGEMWTVGDTRDVSPNAERSSAELENLNLEALNADAGATIKQVRHSAQVWSIRAHRIDASTFDGIQFHDKDPKSGLWIPMDQKGADAVRAEGEKIKLNIGVEERKKTRNSMLRLCALRIELIAHRLQDEEAGGLGNDGFLNDLCSHMKTASYDPEAMDRLAINVGDLQKSLKSALDY